MGNPRRPMKRSNRGGGESDLHAAARSGDLRAVESICNSNPLAVNARDGHSRTPLHLAAWSGQTEVVSFLCKNKADVGAAAMDDMGSIHFASQKGHFEVVRILLASGASVKAVNRKGFTPLHYAVQGSHCELIKYLVRKGSSLAAKTKSGQTPLDLANSEEVRSCLVEAEQSRKKGDEGAGSKKVEVAVAMQSDDEQKGPDANEVTGKAEGEDANEVTGKAEGEDANEVTGKAEGEDEIGRAKREAEETNEDDLSGSKKARVSLDHLSAENDSVDVDEE